MRHCLWICFLICFTTCRHQCCSIFRRRTHISKIETAQCPLSEPQSMLLCYSTSWADWVVWCPFKDHNANCFVLHHRHCLQPRWQIKNIGRRDLWLYDQSMYDLTMLHWREFGWPDWHINIVTSHGHLCVSNVINPLNLSDAQKHYGRDTCT